MSGIHLLLDAQIGDEFRFYTAQGSITGKLIDILPAKEIPPRDKVVEYYSKDETYKYWKSIASALNVDRLIIRKPSLDYFIVPRTNKADRFLLEVERIRPCENVQ